MPTNRELAIILRMRDEATKKLQQFERNFSGRLRQLGNSISSFLRRWRGLILGITGAITAAGVTFKRMMTDFVQYGLEIDKAAKTTGLMAEQIERLRYAAIQEHADLDLLVRSLANLNLRITYASQGLTTYIRAFETLGIQYKNADGTLRSAYDVFLDLADIVARNADKTEVLGSAMQLLGSRAAKELVPFMKLGRDRIKELGDEAERLGIVLDEKTIKALKQFDDEITKMKQALHGAIYGNLDKMLPLLKDLVNFITNDAIPAFAEFTKELHKFIEENKEFNETFRETLRSPEERFGKKALATLGLVLRKGIFGVMDVWQATEEMKHRAIIQRRRGAVAAAEAGAITAGIPFAEQEMQQLKERYRTGEQIVQQQEHILQIESALVDKKSLYNTLLERASTEIKKQRKTVDELYEAVKEGFRSFEEQIDPFLKWWDSLPERIQTVFLQSIQGMQETFSDFIYDAFISNLKNAEDYFRDFMRRLYRIWADYVAQMAAEKLFGQLANPKVEGFGLVGRIIGAIVGGSSGTSATASSEVGTLYDWVSESYKTFITSRHRGGIIAHRGLAVDEIPVIAQRGEGIISRQGMEVLARLNEGQLPAGNVTYIINAVDAASFADLCRRNPEAIQMVVQESINRNTVLRDVIRRGY